VKTPIDKDPPYVYFRRHRRRDVRFWTVAALLCLIVGGLALIVKYVHDTVTDHPPFNYEPYRDLTPRSIEERQRSFREWELREAERRRLERDRIRRGQQGRELTDEDYSMQKRSR
jgi:hypothetical protein